MDSQPVVFDRQNDNHADNSYNFIAQKDIKFGKVAFIDNVLEILQQNIPLN